MTTIPATVEVVMARGNAAKVTTQRGIVTVEQSKAGMFHDPAVPVPEAYIIRAKQDGDRLITDGSYITLDRTAAFELICELLRLVKPKATAEELSVISAEVV